MSEIIGKIISSSLGYVGKPEIPYGYIDLVTKDGEQIHLKVDVHTFHETLDSGYEVEVEFEHLGSTEILVAKTISILGELNSSKKMAKAAT